MEYYLCRAMEVCRLSPEQLEKLQAFEKSERVLKDYNPITGTYKRVERSRRCLNPWEIQACFGLPPLKERYGIPVDHLASQDAHNQRLRSEFRLAGLAPERDFSLFHVDQIHEFDQKAIDEIIRNGKTPINLKFQGSFRSKKMSDQFEDEQ